MVEHGERESLAEGIGVERGDFALRAPFQSLGFQRPAERTCGHGRNDPT